MTSKYPTADYYIKHLESRPDLKKLWFVNRCLLTEDDYEQIIEALDDNNFKRTKEILTK